jgi:hypothetical protein
MQKPTLECALLAAMVARHAWGSPISETDLLSVAAVESHQHRRASRALQRLRERRYVRRHPDDRVSLVTDEFGRLADVLYHDCGWEPFEIRLRLKHYEGWETHEWC